MSALPRDAPRGDAFAALAAELSVMATLVNAVDELPRGGARLRAAAALADAHISVDRALLARGSSAERWAPRAIECLERATSAMAPSSLPPRLDGRLALLAGAKERAATAERHGARSVSEERRWQLLQAGASLRGRLAMLFRVGVEVATRPEGAAELAALVPAEWRDAACRIVTTGCIEAGREGRFVAEPNRPDVVARYPPSLPLARALAAIGSREAVREIVATVPRADRGAARPLDAVAAWAGGGEPEARGALRALGPGPRDRALVAIARLELDKGRSADAERVAADIRSPALRRRALADVLRWELARGIVRRGLLQAVRAGADPLERALLDLESAIAGRTIWAAREHLETIGRRLRAAGAAETSLTDEGPCAWERAARCALLSALAGVPLPDSLELPRARLRAIVRRRRFAGAVWPFVPEGRRAFHDALARIPAWFSAGREMLVAERIARAAASLRIDVLLASATRREADELGAPRTWASALVAGAFGEDTVVPRAADDPIRAAFDLGIALSPRAAYRGRAILAACTAVLRSASLPADVVSTRIACLYRLARASSAQAARKLLEDPSLAPEAAMPTLAVLASRSPAMAATTLFRHFARLTTEGRFARSALSILTARRAIPTTYSAAVLALAGSGAFPTRDLFARWWQGFAGTWIDAVRALVPERIVELTRAALTAGHLPREGRAAFEHVRACVRLALDRGLSFLLDEAPASDLDWVVAVEEPLPDHPWSVERWRRVLHEARSSSGEPAPEVVDRLVRRLPRAEALRARLLAGAPPTSELERPIELRPGVTLRFLDKRRDVLALLRLPDAAPCCFSSASPHYEGTMATAQWVRRLWRDPLSYGMQIRSSSSADPIGFVFGGYGLFDGPALLLNGIYLKRQGAEVRAAVLRAIERHFAAPLGIADVATANVHGGAGSLPDDYVHAVREGTRLRALAGPDGLDRSIADDISRVVNAPVKLHLFWKRLTPGDAPPRLP